MYRHTERLRTWKLEWLGACRKCSWIDRTPIGAAVGQLENTDTSLIQCDTMDERREIFSLLVSSGRLLSLSTGEVCPEEAVCLLCVQQRVQESQREGWYQPLDSGVHIEEGSVPAKWSTPDFIWLYQRSRSSYSGVCSYSRSWTRSSSSGTRPYCCSQLSRSLW